MEKITFSRADFPAPPANYNGGQRVEWFAGYVLGHRAGRANNRPAESGGDVGAWQVKSPKASLSDRDNCTGYAFGFADADFLYLMSKSEWEQFTAQFTYLDTDSRKNGGKPKRRIRNDSHKMRAYLEKEAQTAR